MTENGNDKTNENDENSEQSEQTEQNADEFVDATEESEPEKVQSEEDFVANFVNELFGVQVPVKMPKKRTSKPKKQPLKWSFGRKLTVIIPLILIVLAGLVFASSDLVTSVLWYIQTGYENVLFTEWGMRGAVGGAMGLVVAVIMFVSMFIAYKSRPEYPQENGILAAFGDALTKHATKIMLAISLLVGVIIGLGASRYWAEILLMINSTPFGKTDPQFGNDISFYVFVLPGLGDLVSFLITALMFGLAGNVAVHAVFGSVRFQNINKSRSVSKSNLLATPARIQLAVYAAILSIVFAGRTYLSMFDTLTNSSDKITGATFTDVHANIPAKLVMTGILVAIAVLFIVIAATAKWRLVLWGFGGLAVSFVVLNIAFPLLVQNFYVTPNAQTMEAPYIDRNIDATKDAYGLNDVEVTQYTAKTEGDSSVLQQDAEVAAQIRLLDPQIVSPTFKQLQQNKQYYNFADTLAVDKYMLNGKSRDTVIAARELSLQGSDQRNWVNDHTVYTHGYGIVAAYGNEVNSDGTPKFFERNIPNTGELTEQDYEPRIYFSPNSPEYSIVGSSNASDKWEFDYPTDDASGGITTQYAGDGGPKTSNMLVKAMYAIKFGSTDIFFSSRVNDGSQVLYTRNPVDRVREVAPYLSLDGRVYPAVVDGRVKWIVDAYTTSDSYPYSEAVDFNEATKDSTTETSNTVTALNSGVKNYIRNSVKATVDAYDGSIDLYAWDAEDPILQSWSKIFPNTYKSVADISSDLMAHMRYPESLFKVQRSLLARYHVDDASQFFSGEDFWQLPDDPVTDMNQGGAAHIDQPPYYLTMQMPGTKEPVFSLSTSFIPAGNNTREILTGFMTADSDAGNVAGKIGENYGTIRMLELPKNSTVPGPGQVQNNFNANATVSKELNLLQTGASQVTRGNLLTLPIGGGLVYVQPVYVQSSGNTSYPLLKKVLVAFGDKVGFDDTLNGALSAVFSGDPLPDGDSGSGTETPDSGGNSGTPSTDSEIQKALKDAKQAYDDAQSALAKGDWSAYGEAQKRLEEALGKVKN
ncbi:MAG: UPF0182 family protein [Bifidobacteriaceae bacterium]|jgi:uncharacterized membrane protein (UPF0182 family)|nr:UPF0182 family protein [Bifidobacteriaceae bacterium]